MQFEKALQNYLLFLNCGCLHVKTIHEEAES